MPCDTRMTASIEFKATMFKTVAKSMQDLGWQVYYNKDGVIKFTVDGVDGVLRNGKITFTGSYGIDGVAERKTTELKRAHGKRIAKLAAKKFGFEVKTVKPGSHYQLVRE